jgi:RNA polymerase sigma-70 factor (ECF subfamily)
LVTGVPFCRRMNAIVDSKPNRMQEVLAAARNGDHAAFTTLVAPHRSRLLRFAFRFTRNAEDVCQESLLKAFTKLHLFTGDGVNGDLRSWLMRVTANSAIDFTRRKQSGRFVPLDECEPILNESGRCRPSLWKENPEVWYARKERLRMLADAIAQLPAALRDVCLLRNVSGLSTQEVAARLGISIIAVRLRLFRAYRRLKNNVSGTSAHRVQQRNRSAGREASRRSNFCGPLQYRVQQLGKTECAYGD